MYLDTGVYRRFFYWKRIIEKRAVGYFMNKIALQGIVKEILENKSSCFCEESLFQLKRVLQIFFEI